MKNKFLLDTGIVRRMGTNENVKKRYASLNGAYEKAYISVWTLHEINAIKPVPPRRGIKPNLRGEPYPAG
jgi:hypothetical protein